jgi:hypothetical protein
MPKELSPMGLLAPGDRQIPATTPGDDRDPDHIEAQVRDLMARRALIPDRGWGSRRRAEMVAEADGIMDVWLDVQAMAPFETDLRREPVWEAVADTGKMSGRPLGTWSRHGSRGHRG